MCLDIKLLQLSHGKYGIMNLIHDLSNKYGKQRGFKDSALFGEIEKLTYPEIGDFLRTYVSGPQPLPLKEVFSIVGVNFEPEVETKDSSFSLGRIGLTVDGKTNKVLVADTAGMNPLGYKLGYRKGDELVSINGKDITVLNENGVISNLYRSSNVGDSLVIKVKRKDAGGNEAPAELRATMTKYPVRKFNVLTFSEQPTDEQTMLRDAWLKPRTS